MKKVLVKINKRWPMNTRVRGGVTFTKKGVELLESDVTDGMRNDPALEIVAIKAEEKEKAEVAEVAVEAEDALEAVEADEADTSGVKAKPAGKGAKK